MFFRTLTPALLVFTATLAQAEPAPAPAATPAATAAAASTAPDLAIEGSLNEILIGGGTGLAARSVTFRHRQLIMYPDWAVGGTAKGECKIQITYNLSNLSDLPSGTGFKVQLLNNDKVVGEDTIEALAPRQSKAITTHGLFTTGHNWFTIRIDSGNAVKESNEANNDQKFDYTLNGKCSAATKAKMPAPAATPKP